jgi:FAD:protein FMN transferase
MITRRTFIRISCLFPLALRLDAGDVPDHTEEVRALMMGTFVQIKGVGVPKGVLQGALSRMRELETIFTRHGGEGSLATLNRDGTVTYAPLEFISVMERTAEAHRETSGLFDPTVLPALLVMEQHHRPLTEDERSRCTRITGFHRVAIESKRVAVEKGVQLTLDGVAKGYIIDEGVKRLRNDGAVSVLVNVGGDIYCGQHRKGWEVGIYDPARDCLVRTLMLTNAAVATSGNYVNYFTEDRSAHHIIDPRTLSSPSGITSVTVTAAGTMRADILSTAIFVAGADGKRFLKEGERAYLLTSDGREITL